MWTWKAETPATVPAGARISAGIVGQGRQVVAEGRAHLGEAVTGELHAVAGVAGEADDDPLDGLPTRRSSFCGHGHLT